MHQQILWILTCCAVGQPSEVTQQFLELCHGLPGSKGIVNEEYMWSRVEERFQVTSEDTFAMMQAYDIGQVSPLLLLVCWHC